MKKELEKDWTHKQVEITDIRKLKNLYAITIENIEISQPLFVKHHIFEDRCRCYFLKDMRHISREDVLKQKWNMHITKGYIIKIREGEIEVNEENMNPEKYYISFLEIEGPLGEFNSVMKK